MNHLAFVFGLLGNIVSFLVFLAPLPTFRIIYKKKSTEGFQSVPYVVGLFSAMLWLYYASVTPDTTLLVTINSVGCFIQTAYISLYIFYAPKRAKILAVKLLVLVNVVGFGLIVLLTRFLANESNRNNVVGWICLVFSLCVFVAPLCVVRQVIRTKSVEYMPFLLSFFLTLSAVMWFFFGLLRKDYNIAIPNVLGFTFGLLQMLLYITYKNAKKVVIENVEVQSQTEGHEEHKTPVELKEQVIDIAKLSATVCPGITPVVVPPPPPVANDIALNLDGEKTPAEK